MKLEEGKDNMIQSDTAQVEASRDHPVGGDVSPPASRALELKVLQAARDWMIERTAGDVYEKALVVAIARAWPEELFGKETCKCGDSKNCDECPSIAEIEALICRYEKEVAETFAEAA